MSVDLPQNCLIFPEYPVHTEPAQESHTRTLFYKKSAQQETISQKHEFCTEKTVTPEGTNVIRLTEAL